MNPQFTKHLKRVQRLMRTGRVAVTLLGVAVLVGLLWAAFGLGDAFAAFEPAARVAITKVLLGLVAVSGSILLLRALQVDRATAAAKADEALADPRQSASSGLSLPEKSEHSPLSEYLTRRTLDEAANNLAAIPASKIFPCRCVAKVAVILLVMAGIAFGLKISAPAAFSTVTSRLLHPGDDIPPYSPLVFKISPANPACLYGGTLDLTAEITGAALEHPVQCLVKQARTGEVLRLPAFRESSTRYSRKLDGLTEPVEIAFACGKARSRWLKVEILLEPRILAGTVHLTPPAHTGLTETSFALDTNEIAAIEGSSVTLELTSNRPLAAGSLALTPAAAPGVEAKATSYLATLTAPQRVSFTWTAVQSGKISANVSDLRGTSAASPLELTMRMMPDQAPVVELTSPPRQLLATPKSIIPVSGTASDDFALSKLQFVRTLAGFRDRIRVVAPALHQKAYAFEDKLDLDALGLEAGQTIELMLEATDHNPSLLGSASSEISRIRIISEDQYAEYIRAKTTIAQFAARFQAARDAMDQARKALEKLKDALDKNDAPAAAKALDEARKAHRDAADLLDKIADDFPAFELEKRLQELAEQQAEDLRANLDALEKLDPAGDEAGAEVEKLLEKLGQRKQQEQQLDEDVALARKAASILEMAAKFRQIYENQVSLAKRFGSIVEEFRHGDDHSRRLLPSLADTQTHNRGALMDFKTELHRRLDAADDEPLLESLVASATQFLTDLDAAAPETLMDAAAGHAKAGEATDAYANAELARAQLERLLSKPDEFPKAAMGDAPEFKVPHPDVNATIEEMLKALLGQNPGGQGSPQAGGEGAQGPGGFGGQGVAGGGFPMDLPVIGPERLQFEPAPGLADGGNGNGRTGPIPPLPETAETGTLENSGDRHGKSSSVSLESIPEPYREAVKRFFTP